MKLAAKSIQEGKCYSTRHKELRHVVMIAAGGLTPYDTRKRTEDGGWSAPRRYSASLESFAREAVSEVPCL